MKRKPNRHLAWLLCLWLTPSVFAQEILKRRIPSPNPIPTIDVEEPNRNQQDRFQLVTEFSLLSPTIIEGESFRSQKDIGGVPVFFGAVRFPLFRKGNFQTAAEIKLGVGTNKGRFQVVGGGSRSQESARVLVVPLVASFQGIYSVPGLPFLKPCLSVGLGGQFLSAKNEVGQLRELWTPFINLHPSVLFLQNTDPEDWFGGFSFGGTRWWGVGYSRVSAWSVDTAFYLNL